MLNVWVVNFKLSLHDELQDVKGKNYLFLIQAEHKLLKIHISFVDFAQHSQELEVLLQG